MRIPLSDTQVAIAGFLTVAAAALLAVACDGVSWTGPADVDQSPSGLYLGSFTRTDVQPSPNRETIGMISEDLVAHFLLADQHYAGFVSVEGRRLSGNLTEYGGRQGVFLGFAGLSAVSLVAEVLERDGISGAYTGNDTEGRLALTYSSAYEDGSSLDLLAGIWSYSQAPAGGGVYTYTMNLDNDGQLFATDTSGCVFNGQLAIVDDRFAVYAVAVTVSNCGAVDGNYDGLAYFASEGAGDFLYLASDNGQFAFANRSQRL